jgi:predicted transposase YdaD
MLQVQDIRQTRVYQEALEEGREEGREEGLEKGRKLQAARSIVNMSAKNMPAEEIAAFLEVDLEFVHQVQKEQLGRDRE